MKKEYYVYALIDPRNNEYFYIGKGKGKRYNSHINENLKNTKNIYKFSRIDEIKRANLEVKVEILFPYLTEEVAFELEKIIIYKIGRESHREGNLLNFAPGGIWSTGESLFYETKPSIDFNLDLLDFVAQEKFLSIKKTSNIIHLDEISPQYFIHKYDLNGTLISIDSITCFFKDKNTIGLFFEINNEKLPIFYAEYIYSKKPIIDFYFSRRLISLNQNLFEPLFLKEIEVNLKNKNDFYLELKQYDFSRINVKLESNIFKIETFYQNNSIRNLQYLKDGKPYGKWLEHYENGKLKFVTEYFSSGKLSTREHYSEKGLLQFKKECFENGRIKKTWNYYSNGSIHYFDEHCIDWKMVFRTFYYPNGEKKYSYNNFNKHIEYSYYNENGKLIEEFVSNKGYVKYNLNRDIISVCNTKHMDFIDPYKVLAINQTKSYSYRINSEEKRKADEDWQQYNDFINENK